MSRWLYPILGLIVNTMLGGLYAFSLYYPSLQKAFNLEAVAPLALAYSLATLFFAIGMIPGGVLFDKKGPKIGIILGAILIIVGYALGFSIKDMPWSSACYIYWIGLGVLAGLGIGFAYAVPGPTAIKWFPERPGAATGVAVLGFGIGAAFSTPLITYFISTVGPFTTFLYMGLIYGIVMIICGALMKLPPPDFKPPVTVPVTTPPTGVKVGEAIRDKRFYFLWLSYVFAAFAGLMIIGNAAPIVREGGAAAGFPAAEVALIIPTFVFVTSIFNAIGRPFWGSVLDKVGPWKAMQLNYITAAIVLVILSLVYRINPWFAFVAVITYLCYGGVLAMYPSATAIYFGRLHLGKIYGILFTAWGVAGLTGGMSGAMIRDITGSYFLSFYVAMILSLIAAAMAAIGARLKAKPKPA